MSFETVKKLSNFSEVTTAGDLQKIFQQVPITENVSGLQQGDTIESVGAMAAGYVTIRGIKSQNPTVVMECTVVNAAGDRKVKPIYLSTLIRKHDLQKPFEGMLGTDAAFKNASDFDYQKWHDALKASVPFKVEKVDTIDREINRDNVPTIIKSRQLFLAKLPAGGENPTKGMSAAQRKAYNTENGTDWKA
jgi:hypothetical protein